MSLPEKWTIKVDCNNQSILHEFYKKNIDKYPDCKLEWTPGLGGYFHYPPYEEGVHTTSLDMIKNWTVITLEQFLANQDLKYEIY